MIMNRLLQIFLSILIVCTQVAHASTEHHVNHSDILEKNHNEVQMSDIIIYTKKVCPYCVRAKDLFDRKGWAYTEIDLDKEPGKIKEMLELSKRRTVPQIFIKGQHIGGCDDLLFRKSNKIAEAV